MSDRWHEWFATEAESIRAAGRWREPRDFDARGPEGTLGGDRVVSFASNDYLGLTAHPAVMAASIAAIERWGAGSGASRLIVGSRPVHRELEEALAAWRRTDAALSFPTGFAANVGLLSTLGAPGVRIHSDALNHASIIDGVRVARANGAEVRVHPHLDLIALADALAQPGAQRQIVVTDSVFSMDGDVAPVDDLRRLCERHDALLVLDEAHAVLEPVPTPGSGVVQVGTLSKTLGALGGYVAADGPLIDLLVNRARTWIFTTASSPGDAAGALAAIGVLRSTEGAALVERLRRLVERVAPGHRSPIIPIVLGDERAALEASARLLAAGLFVPAIRPPTVPVGTSRLRIALSAAHTDAQVDALLAALDGLLP